MASESIILEAVDFVPDVVLIVNGMNLHRRAFDLLKRLRLPVIMLLTESPYLDEWQAKIATQGHAAAILTNDKNSVKPLSNMTGLPVEYLPHSYDAERHRPRPIDDYYATDIFFHGTLFPERMDTFITLGELIDDYKIHIDGIILDGEHEISEDDLMDNREMAFYYANTKVVLNKHRTIAANIKGEDLHIGANEAYSIGPRLYEAAACGAFQVSDGSRPELHDVFNGHIPTYRDGDELLEMVRYYLIHDKEREAMADAAREAVQGCTFENRAQNIVIPFFMEVTNGSTL
jgi:spore maturation protein CgeB